MQRYHMAQSAIGAISGADELVQRRMWRRFHAAAPYAVVACHATFRMVDVDGVGRGSPWLCRSSVDWHGPGQAALVRLCAARGVLRGLWRADSTALYRREWGWREFVAWCRLVERGAGMAHGVLRLVGAHSGTCRCRLSACQENNAVSATGAAEEYWRCADHQLVAVQVG